MIQRVDWLGERRGEALQEAIDQHVRMVLADSETLTEAAKRLGVNQSTLWRWRDRPANRQLARRLFGRQRVSARPYCRRCGFDGPRRPRCPGCTVNAWLARAKVVAISSAAALAAILALSLSPLPARAAVLTFTAPMWEELADTTCGVPGQPLGDLARVTLYGVKRYETTPRLLRVKAIYLAGVADSLAFPDSGYVWTCWVTFTDRAGNESCRSNLVGVNLTTDVPDGAPPRDWRVMDISGRILATLRGFSLAEAVTRTRGRSPGFYYLRSTDGMAARTVLVIR